MSRVRVTREATLEHVPDPAAVVREMVSARLDNALANYLTRSVLNLQETLDAALAAIDASDVSTAPPVAIRIEPV